ncbi:hypothetical protein [Desulfomonile tiedjei]|uniref:Uncharacterized protein n=1 Tax=Desulfomonile tiedjei (strain ATCC 49306 / DSM 6799 / DCB-1) TaxID=706587 RepID=I4CCF5_DESTA|nr:hypothetical protein [Desulfomonile tiedjei]AFM27246.1 hypothetical protein Desti_4622 [Desulfomonile tiedjei DSM 6799]
MRDYSALHSGNWLEDISAGDSPNMVTIAVRTTEGKIARFHVAKRPLLDRIKDLEMKPRKRKLK